jgi:GntR family transcriptional regulator
MALKKLENFSVPLHQQLVANLRSKIVSGKLKSGDFLGTEKSLMDQYGVSSTTVRRALQALTQEGYLFRKAGKGTFIRRVEIEASGGPLWSFYEEMKSLGLKPSSKLLSIEVQKPNLSIAQKLNLAKSDPIYYIKKLLKANDEPVAILESYWQFQIGEQLSKFDLNSTNLFKILENGIGINLGEAEATLEAGIASSEEAKLLGIRKKNPILIMQRVVYSVEGNPIFFSRLCYRADKYKFRTRMVRGPFKSIPNKAVIKNMVS